ncbi:MAG: hypothetical protein QOD83_2951 [Solirubrobacteraceae bacterium]|nr:hypothetical protein [Solirubrobacteraceae bacterium]
MASEGSVLGMLQGCNAALSGAGGSVNDSVDDPARAAGLMALLQAHRVAELLHRIVELRVLDGA